MLIQYIQYIFPVLFKDGYPHGRVTFCQAHGTFETATGEFKNSIFFFFFPAGLVLYWLINNILSILQQWQIQRMFDRDKPAHAKR